MKLNAYDVVQLVLVLSVLGLILANKLTFVNLSFVIILMVIVVFVRVMGLEDEISKPKEDRAEKLKEARKWDELISRISKMREELQARIGIVESKISSEKAVEERLAKLYEKIIGIENRVTKTTKTLASSYDVLDRRIKRMEQELGFVEDQGEAE